MYAFFENTAVGVNKLCFFQVFATHEDDAIVSVSVTQGLITLYIS